jgi:hypothetical protein
LLLSSRHGICAGVNISNEKTDKRIELGNFEKQRPVSLRRHANAVELSAAQIKMNANRKTGVALILFVSLVLVGCTAPYATVNLKPFPDTAAESEIIEPDYPDIQEALTTIDSVLTKNGYVTEASWLNGTNTSRGWWIVKTYTHKKPNVDATVYNEGAKKPTTVLKAGKRSVQIYVVFQEPMRWFLKVHPDVTRVRDEIAGELAKRFGQEKVTTVTGREEVQLQ